MLLKKIRYCLVFLSLSLSIQLFCSSGVQNDEEKPVASKKSIITKYIAICGAIFVSVSLFLWWQDHIKVNSNSLDNSDNSDEKIEEEININLENNQSESTDEENKTDVSDQEENAKATYYQNQFLKKSKQWLENEYLLEGSIDSRMSRIYNALSKNNFEFVTGLHIPELKKGLKNGWYLTDGQKEHWFIDKFLETYHQKKDGAKENCIAILATLDCFYPTEFLLSRDCLTASGQNNTFAHIGYKLYGSFFDHKEQIVQKNLKFLYSMLGFGYSAHASFNNKTIFDFLFTEENLQKNWLQELLKEEGIAHLDVICELLSKKDEAERNAILNALKGIGNNFKIALENFEIYSNPVEIIEPIFNDFNYKNIILTMNNVFFTSHEQFSQLLYKLMEKQETFKDCMESIFDAPFFDEEKNVFFDTLKYEYETEKDMSNGPLNYVYKYKNNFRYLENSTPGGMASDNNYVEEKKRDKDFITKYTAIRNNTLLLLRWYDIYSAINLYEDQGSGFFKNKEYLRKIFNENLRHYKSDFTRPSQFGNDLKETTLCKNSNDIINISKTYHLFINFQDNYTKYQKNSLFDRKEEFTRYNLPWIAENEMCTLMYNEVFDNMSLQV